MAEDDDIEEFLQFLEAEETAPAADEAVKTSGFQFGATVLKPPPDLARPQPVVAADITISKVFGFHIKGHKDVSSLTHGKRFVPLPQIPLLSDRKKEIAGDWVTAGVVLTKKMIPAKLDRKAFTIWNLCDMHDMTKTASLLIFSQVQNVEIGTVIALLNPVITATKSKEDHCSLKLDHILKLLILGQSSDLGRCAAVTKGGTPCSSFVNKSHSPNCIFHINMEYKTLASSRPELKATYSGIQPKTQSTAQQVDVKSNIALMGPQSNKAMAASAKRALEASEKARQQHFDLKRQMEENMISDALKNPLSIAARNLARATGSSLPSNSTRMQIIDNRVDISKFAAAKDVLKETKPRLGRGLNPGQIVFGPDPSLLRKNRDVRKELAELKKVAEAVRQNTESEALSFLPLKPIKPLTSSQSKRPLEAIKQSPSQAASSQQKRPLEVHIKESPSQAASSSQPKRPLESVKESPASVAKKLDHKKRKLEDIQARLKSKISSLPSDEQFAFDLN